MWFWFGFYIFLSVFVEFSKYQIVHIRHCAPTPALLLLHGGVYLNSFGQILIASATPYYDGDDGNNSFDVDVFSHGSTRVYETACVSNCINSRSPAPRVHCSPDYTPMMREL